MIPREVPMVLEKDELVERLNHEVRILLHLVSKARPADLDYRPAPRQRSLQELLEYLTVFPIIHVRTVTGGVWDGAAWGEAWRTEQAAAKGRSLDEIRNAIGRQPNLFADLIHPLADQDLRSEMEMFGRKSSRGELLVWMVLCHYAAYRMQLFLYLKACGREELGTMDLWAGIDAVAPKA
jgi:hypothetical protein